MTLNRRYTIAARSPLRSRWVSVAFVCKVKFSKISCVDTARGDSPGLPFGTPVPHPHAPCRQRRATTTVRRAKGRWMPFSISVFGIACEARCRMRVSWNDQKLNPKFSESELKNSSN